MLIPPEALEAISGAAALVGHEFLKGTAGEAGKGAWRAVKGALGWSVDPPAEEIQAKVKETLSAQPELTDRLLDLLKANGDPKVSGQVDSIYCYGGKVTIIGNVFGGATF